MLIAILSAVYMNGHEVISKINLNQLQNLANKYYIIELKEPVYETYKTQISNEGISLLEYLPKNAFIVKANNIQIQKISQKSFIKAIYSILPQYKLPIDYQEKLNTCYIKKDDLYLVRILYYEKENLKNILAYISSKGLQVEHIDSFINYVQTYIPLNILNELINLEFVKYVEFQYPAKAFNNRAVVLHQSGNFLNVQNITDVNDTIVWKKGIRGDGQILGHFDDGFDKNHCFFNGNVNGQNKQVWVWYYQGNNNNPPVGTNCNSNPGAGCHGTHTAGTAAGGTDNLASNLAYRGMAPKARIVSQASCCETGAPALSTVLNDAYQRGARVHTNSWGYICGGFLGTTCAPYNYNTDAQTIDQFVWNNNDMVIVFAAGNHGDDNCSAGCSRAASNPASAKNDITVAAMARAVDAKMGWSAYGNYPSGRFSIDIMAKGDTTYSAWGGTACDVTTAWWWMGTSMATPVVAGSALLLRQYFNEGWYGDGTKNSAPSINPSAALIKAAILASARPTAHDGDVSFGNEPNASNNPAPNGNEGAGRLILDNVMYFSPEDNWLTSADSSDIRKSRIWFVDNTTGISTGQTHTYSINLCKNMLTRIVLAWSDYPANTGCNTSSAGCLVNDLDLRVEKGSDFWLGNVRPTAVTTNDIDTTRMNINQPDRANNWEIVRIIPPKDTIYTIKVIGYNVPQGPQKYALLVSGGIGCQPVTPVDINEKGERIYKYVNNTIIFNAQKPLLVRIYSISGQKVLEQFIQTGYSKIDINSLKSSIYILHIYEGKELKAKDIIIKR